jgi:hypothetical protein
MVKSALAGSLGVLIGHAQEQAGQTVLDDVVIEVHAGQRPPTAGCSVPWTGVAPLARWHDGCIDGRIDGRGEGGGQCLDMGVFGA